MKRSIFLIATIAFLVSAGVSWAGNDVTYLLTKAVADLKIDKKSQKVCTLTNAPYVTLNGKDIPEVVDDIQGLTGCSIGKGNLLFFQRPRNHSLLIALSREDTGQSVAIRHDGKTGEAFHFNIKGDQAIDAANFASIRENIKGDTFSIVSLFSAHAKGASYEFMKCCEHHNHACPGVTSGFYIAKQIQRLYPAAPGEKYIWIACPPWCKDDAISTILDLTPGKRNIFIKNMAGGRPTEGPTGRFAGIIVRWEPETNKGKAAVMEFDWERAYEVAGIKSEDLNPKGGPSNPSFFTARLKCTLSLIPYLDQAERFVSVFKEADIDAGTLARMEQAGEDPYEILGVAH